MVIESSEIQHFLDLLKPKLIEKYGSIEEGEGMISFFLAEMLLMKVGHKPKWLDRMTPEQLNVVGVIHKVL